MITYHVLEAGLLKAQVAEKLDTIPANIIWIDMLRPTDEEVSFIETAMDIDIPTREEMAEIEDSSRFYESKNGLCMTVSVLSGSQNPNPVLTELSFVLSPKLLVCVHYGELTSFHAFETQYQRQPQIIKTTDGLIMILVDAVVDRIADILEKIQLKLNELSSDIFNDTESNKTCDLQATVKKLGKYNSLLAKLSDSLLSIRRLLIFCKQSTDWLAPTTKTQMNAIDKDISSLTEYHTRMSSEITFLLDATLGLINIEQNGIIKVFSIAAVLFLPPTLVGTIYGMNFKDMPELAWSFGYPISITLMILSAVGCYAWFKIKNWL